MFEIRFTDGAEVVSFIYMPPKFVMCIGDGNPKPEVTITGPDIRIVGKEVVEAEITEKEVLSCHAENSLKRASKKLTGNAASVLPSFVCHVGIVVFSTSISPCPTSS